MYALLTVVEPSEEGDLNFVETLADPRFSIADSGLYAYIYDNRELRRWNSTSAFGVEPPLTVGINTVERNFGREANSQGEESYIKWCSDKGSKSTTKH